MSDFLSTTRFEALIAAGLLEIGDGYRAKNEELGGDGPIFLRAGHVRDTYIDFDGVERFRRDREAAVGSKMSAPGDTIITTKGNSTGRTSYVGDEMPRFVYSPHLSYWRSRNPARLHPLFLRYWSRGPEFQDQLQGMKASTDMAPYLSLTDQRRLRITLLRPEDQATIGSLLGALDDKITLNRRMNGTLETTAAALFRSWFVDFDPIVANVEARRIVGVPAAVQKAMPSTFDQTPVGAAPNGWRVEPIGQLVRVVGGSTPRTGEPSFWDGKIRWATPKDLAQLDAPVLVDPERRITEAGLRQISSGLLPAGTVLLSSRAPIGYVAIAAEPTAINQGFIALVCDGLLPNTYVYHWLRENMDTVVSRANGTTFLEISKTNFRPIPALRPDVETLKAFTWVASPLHQRIEANVRENRTLATLRDMLLPQLLSGTIRLRQVEKLVEAAV